jgi:PAS domain S-box-containing protein
MRPPCSMKRLVLRLVLCLGLAALTMAADSLTLSPTERDWVARHPVVRIQMSDVSPPFEFRADGRWQGLAYDSLLAACRRIGLQVQVTGMPWAKALEGVGTGTGVDLLLAVTSSPERASQMLLTKPYLAFPQVIIADRHHTFISGLADLRGSSIAVERDYVMEGWLRRDLPSARLLVVDDSLPALSAVATRRADAYVGNLAVASYLIDRHGLVNLGVAAPSGYGDEEFAMGVRKDWPELVALLDRAFAEMPPEELLKIRQPWLSVRYEHGLRYADIAMWVLIVSGVLLVFIVQLRRMVRHRTAELAHEVALRREREVHLAEAQRIAHLGSWTRNLASGGIVWSEEIRRIFGWPAGRPATAVEHLDVIHPEDRGRLAEHLRNVVEGGQPDDLEFRITRPSGEVRHLIQRCHLLDGEGGERRVQGIVQDVTARKLAEDERVRLERSLQHAEKLRVLGQLAGGIAHDFNNMLGGITGHAELLKVAVAGGQALPAEHVRRHAAGILSAAERAAAITTQLRVHARRDGMDAAPVDVHVLISETAELVRRGAGPGIDVRLDLQSPASIVNGEAALIQTALANLAINARDAMPSGGILVISTGQVQLTGELAAGRSFGIKPGRHLTITVADNGAGMDAGVLTRLFEPFFTTKEYGKGTGLGLANVLACVRSHSGGIEVESRPGHGTTFRLYLPLAEISQVPARIQEVVHGQGLILLVDDDPMLREVTSEMLRTLGYAVTVVEDGVHAEAAFRAQEPRFDLVIADMLMPGMDGRTLIGHLRAIDPRARILIASGAFEDGPAHPIAEADGFLEKPFDLIRLAQRVAETLRAVK